MAEVKEYESQKASRDIHEGGRYVVKSGKPVKDQAEKKGSK